MFRRIRYANLYPGIDIKYYGKGRQLEYDVTVAPYAKPDLVGFAVKRESQEADC